MVSFDFKKIQREEEEWFINKVCPHIRERMPEIVKEYGTQPPYFSTADVIMEHIAVIERNEHGITFNLGEQRKAAEYLGKKIDTAIEKSIKEAFPNAKKRERRNKPIPERRILYETCFLLQQIKRGRTGSKAQNKRLRMLRMYLWLWEHPEDRTKVCIIR